MADENRFEDMDPASYAAMWGCDPVYDLPPRNRGDGYLFYNYSDEGDDPEFLERFLGAIDRTIASCELSPDSHEPYDVEDLEALKRHVQAELGELSQAADGTS
jgi:hypothetical protein